ncbi:MAG: rhomboid family intramembrane serine protease [Elusimicrobia bacterium]|nr:rhomboid family intramembrane serine protease [Elusimicrobiota bacterium]
MGRSFQHAPIDFRSMPGAIKALAIANALGFLLSQIVGGEFYRLFGLVPFHVVADRWIWQPVTYLFIHGTFMHLLFNVFALWMFGMPVEAQWGWKEFLKFYFLCGIGAGLLSVVLAPGSHYPIIGASGAIYGLLVAFAMLYPDAVIYLYFFFPVKAAHMAIIFGLIEFFASATNATPGVARFAHLAGMVIGYLYIRWWWIAKIRIKGLFSDLSRGAGALAKPSAKRSSRRSESPAPAPDPMAEIDRILDKISAHGQDSLSEEEREALRRHADRQRQKRTDA